MSAATASPARLDALQIAAVTVGNGLEFYDFLIYSTFAIYIGKAYFPAHDPVVSLLLSLATFGIGFVTRPIGGIVLGRMGDRIGRKPAMLIAFALMGIGVLALAVTPSYGQIGMASPIIVIAARLVQGFALGGEVGPSTAYLVEAASPGLRGVVGSLQASSQGLAILAASAVAVLLALILPTSALEAWGWRLGFMVGLIIIPFGILARQSLPETAPHHVAPEAAEGPASSVPWRLVILGGLMITGGTINTYVNSYMTTYAMDTLHLSPQVSFGAGVINGGCMFVLAPLGGWLSDRFGRRTVLIPALVLLMAVTLPSFALLVSHPTTTTLFVAMTLVSVPGGFVTGTMLVMITESFPPRMRCLALGTIYAVAVAFFGGTTQVVVAWLVHATGQPMAPAFYRMVALAIALLAVLNMPESSPARIAASRVKATLAAA